MAVLSSALPRVSEKSIELNVGKGLCLAGGFPRFLSESQHVFIRFCNLMVEEVFLHVILSSLPLRGFSCIVEKYVQKIELIRNYKRK